MKKSLIVLFFFVMLSLGWCDEIPQGAINYYANKYGHKHPDTLQAVQVDFKGDGSRQFLMTFANGDWEGPEAVWGVIELKNGQWAELKTLDADGEIKDFSAVGFDPAETSFVFLPSYKHNGILTRARRGRVWTFTYLEKGVLNTLYFWTASQVGLTDDGLKKLMDAHKITVQQITVQ